MLFPIPAAGATEVFVVVVLLFGVIFASAIWVLMDAQALARQGLPVTGSFGTLHLNTPLRWFLACLLLWEIFFPFYVSCRNSA